MKELIFEWMYLFYRRFKAILGGSIYYIFRLYPIDERKVVISNFYGKQGYGCNLKYIVEELIRRNESRSQDKRYKIVWLVNDLEKSFPKDIKKVRNNFWNRAFYLSTSKVWIDNVRKPLETRKRKAQLYIGTWHGAIGFKSVGKLRGKALPKIAYLVSSHDSKLIDYFLSNSEWCSEMYRKAFFYDGKILKSGSPRCDILVNKKGNLRDRIFNEYNIPNEAKILMFAPTFRGGTQKTHRHVFVEDANIDYGMLVKELEKKFGGKWYIFLRLHPTLAMASKNNNSYVNCRNVIDVTQVDDIYELLAITNAFISDYSSMAFDAAIMRIPVFIFAEDINQYVKDRGELLWNMSELPFPVSYSNDDLLSDIRNFDTEKYQIELNEFFYKVGLKEDGHSCDRVADLIEDFISKKG